MLKFYYSLAPNPMKVALFLEESGLEYEAIPVDTRKGQQHLPEFKSVNPNAKVPVIVDGDVRVFDSNGILLYLAEKTGKFLPPAGDKNRGELISWLMFVATGLGPYSGQKVHFANHAPEKIEYVIKRYDFEANRHYGILNDHLEGKTWMVGDTYTIVDMALWGWGRMAKFVLGEEAAAKYPNVTGLVARISATDAAKRAESIKERHAFKTEMDDESFRSMFPGTHS
ncbi:glutathione S-transferase N-terminal domain-containing protein [Thalassobaculum sp. OXR-137]|uniref:glutathione S-transferase family protein n=1 Tax=Thalassobaculum sp. OXR-137 TaxID=3100173 RepID=UPI002AC9B76E|nr:glutathione S-transferase N-terminal domain-containing protein [Thalassobaculum sp. OXR-137]WPZ32942.1 glutathione S-transferase N-terminal domain-containing protein [Thalassobaculum sp. OXR-137]